MKYETDIVSLAREAGGVIDLLSLNSLKIPNARQKISYALKTGKLIRIGRGVYALPEKVDPFLAAKYSSPGYVSFHSALFYYKAVTEVPSTILVATKKLTRTFKVENFEVKEISVGKRFCGYIEKDTRVATRPKAIYDSLRRPDLSGGFSKVLYALWSMQFNGKEWDELLGYMKKFDRPGFFQRMGYLLSLLPAPGWVLQEIKNRCGDSKVYLYGKSKGKLVSEWNVIDNIGKGVLLSWMKG